MVALFVICGASVTQSLFMTEAPMSVIAYGIKANFLHFPLIFVIPKVFTINDVVKMGRWVLILSMPMAVLMAVQFLADPNDYWNYGPGGSEGAQIRGGEGRIRPPGYFSFITGAAQFLALASSITLFGMLRKGVYSMPLLVGSGLAIFISASVSSSRLTLGSIGLVFIMLGVAYLFNKRLPKRIIRLIIPIGIILLVATNLDIYSEGKIAFESRLTETGDFEASWGERATTWIQRIFGDFTSSLTASRDAPFFGHGLGMGTNVGARLVSGRVYFQLAEDEWSRIVLENGVLLGYAYLFLRMAIVFQLFGYATRAARRDMFFPLLLFGCCFLLILTGQVGQSTTMGFLALGGGLTLAAARMPPKRRLPTRHSHL